MIFMIKLYLRQKQTLEQTKDFTNNLHSSLEAAKEAMEKLSTETKEYFERQTELINKAFMGDLQKMVKDIPEEIKRSK